MCKLKKVDHYKEEMMFFISLARWVCFRREDNSSSIVKFIWAAYINKGGSQKESGRQRDAFPHERGPLATTNASITSSLLCRLSVLVLREAYRLADCCCCRRCRSLFIIYRRRNTPERMFSPSPRRKLFPAGERIDTNTTQQLQQQQQIEGSHR